MDWSLCAWAALLVDALKQEAAALSVAEAYGEMA